MIRSAIVVLVVITAAVCVAEAQQAKQVSGTWKKTVGEVNVAFRFTGRALHFSMTEGNKSLDVYADFGTSKDGYVFGRVNKIDKNGIDDGPEVGSLFSFRYEMTKDTLTVSDLRGTDSEQAKNLIQGEYKGAPAKAKKKGGI
jgi:hypothetical protein